jgi:hypothetical protein
MIKLLITFQTTKALKEHFCFEEVGTTLKSIVYLFDALLHEYIVNNILAYKNILTRGKLKSISLEELSKMNETNIREYLNKLTDKEIFNLIESYIVFDSRDTLIGNIIETLLNPRFLLPLKRTRRRGINPEGLTANFADVFEDTSNTILAYGTLLKYKYFFQRMIH